MLKKKCVLVTHGVREPSSAKTTENQTRDMDTQYPGNSIIKTKKVKNKHKTNKNKKGINCNQYMISL
jgi:hypothetical protein